MANQSLNIRFEYYLNIIEFLAFYRIGKFELPEVLDHVKKYFNKSFSN